MPDVDINGHPMADPDDDGLLLDLSGGTFTGGLYAPRILPRRERLWRWVLRRPYSPWVRFDSVEEWTAYRRKVGHV